MKKYKLTLASIAVILGASVFPVASSQVAGAQIFSDSGGSSGGNNAPDFTGGGGSNDSNQGSGNSSNQNGGGSGSSGGSGGSGGGGGGGADQILNGANTTGQEGGQTLEQQIKNVTNVLLFLIGAIAVIVLIVGGIKYVVADGDQGKIKSAKDTIVYALVGLAIAIFAYAIVAWIVGAFAS